MVGTTYNAVLMGLIEVLVEVLVDDADTLCGLDKYKAEGPTLNGGITEAAPINMLLIMTDVYASNIISFWIVGFAVNSFPTEGEGIDKEIPKDEEVEEYHQPDSCQQCPQRYSPPKRFARGLPLAPRLRCTVTGFLSRRRSTCAGMRRCFRRRKR